MPAQRYTFITLLLAAALMASCNPFRSSSPDEITVQLSWFTTVEFAGFYVAEQKGFYKDENLVVSLIPGGPEANPITDVLDGRAQFGVGTGDYMVRARARGEDVVAIASIYRHSPLVAMVLAGSGIERPQDFNGRTIGVVSPSLDTTWDIQFLTMLENLGVDPTTMSFVPIEDYYGANELLSGRMEVVSGFFATNEPVQAELDGHDTLTMFYSDYGVDIYANPIFTTGQMIREQRDLVQRFLRATLKGYQYAIEHPEEATDITLQYDETLEREFQLASMQVQIPLIDTGGVPIGTMDEAIWRTTQEILLQQSVITSPIDINALYTNEFISQSNLSQQ